MKTKTTKILLSITASTALLFLGAGCGTMKVAPLTTGTADSYTQHAAKDGVVVGIRPMTTKGEIKDMFKIDLLDKGLLPILVVAENKSASASFIINKEKIAVRSEATGAATTSQRKEVTSETAATALGMTGGVLAIAGLKMASDAEVIQHNLADKEFYSRTLGPGEKAQGFVYFQFPKGSPPSGNYHVVAEVMNSATGEPTSFDLPVTLTLSH